MQVTGSSGETKASIPTPTDGVDEKAGGNRAAGTRATAASGNDDTVSATGDKESVSSTAEPGPAEPRDNAQAASGDELGRWQERGRNGNPTCGILRSASRELALRL